VDNTPQPPVPNMPHPYFSDFGVMTTIITDFSEGKYYQNKYYKKTTTYIEGD